MLGEEKATSLCSTFGCVTQSPKSPPSFYSVACLHRCHSYKTLEQCAQETQKKKTEIIIKKEAKVWDGIPVSDRAEQFLSPLAGNGNPASVTHEWTSHVVDWSFITNSALGEMRPSDINQMA